MPSYLPFPISHFDISCASHPDNKKRKLPCEWPCEKKIIIILKDFVKQPVIKQTPFFFCFSFLTDCFVSASWFPYQRVCKVWKID